MNDAAPRHYAFGEYRADALTRQLLQADGTPIALTPKVFDTLLYLLQHAGSVVTKEQLLAAVWPGRIVEENNLNQTISALRRVLGANAGDHRYIVTEPGRGYRFVADVQVLSAPAPPTAPAAMANDRTANASARVPPIASNDIQEPARTTMRSPVWFAVALIVLAVAATWLWRATRTSAPTTHPTTIAVLPFKPLLAEDRDEVLELGMADTLITKLSSSRGLVVRSLASVRRFNRIDQDAMTAAKDLDVGAVLEGQIQKNAGTIRVTARLLNVPTGAALWAGTFDEKFDDVFAVQDTIAEKVSNALALELDRTEVRAMSAHYTRNTAAYEAYMSGRYRIGKVTPPEIRAGIAEFRKAIDLDPTYALAYASMADAYRRLPITSDVEPKEAFPMAKVAAEKALEIDDTLADAHSVLGWVALWYDWNWAGAEKEFRRAIELNANVTEAHLGYGGLLSNTGRHAEAMAQARHALELDPISPLVASICASYAAAAGDIKEARRLTDKALAIDPEFWIAHLTLGGLALGATRNDEAIAEFTKARDSSGGSLQAVSMLGYAKARAGDTAAARALVEELEARAQKQYVPATSIATIYAGLGDSDKAIEWLQRSYEQRDVRMSFLKVDRRWDALRSDPRFIEIARQMKLL
ncbi:MAG: winged helix-turn-helix domain-containing protein [Rhodanobacteraceae bacterium]